MAESIHSGHRKRMRERFCKTALAGYQPHEVLEMLLYYGIPRRDTNPVAHALLNEFGSLHGVLSAEPEFLRKVPGMTENSVVLISFLRALYYYDAEETAAGMRMDSYRNVCDFLIRMYRFEKRETVRALMLDAHLCLKHCVVIAEGHPTASDFSVRTLTELSIKTGCNHIILAHNHPSGKASASPEDISVTRTLAETLKRSAVHIVDHVIVSADKAVSLREQGAFFGLD